MRHIKRFLSVILTLALFNISEAQIPGIQWQKTLGGSSYDISQFSFKNNNAIITVSSTFGGNGKHYQ